MKKSFASALFSCFLCFTSCVPSLNPLYTEQDLIFDAALLGVWTDKDSTETWAFTDAGEKEYRLVYIDEDGKKGEFEARLLKIDGSMFLDLTPIGPALTQNDFYKGHILNVHTFVQIAKDGQAFQISYLDPKWLKSHLEKNPGALRYTTVDSEILVTDSPKNLQKFLAANLTTPGAFAESEIVKRKKQAMNSLSRRRFLQGLGAAASLLLAGRHSVSFTARERPFEMLVVGDSHISGQGLSEQNKFYYLVKDWLQTEVFGTERDVSLKVKAHSGSRIDLHSDELEKMKAAGDDIFKFHHPEANLSQPSIRTQIDFARKEYENASLVDLVMLSGGITDVLVANTINPFIKKAKLQSFIHKYCNEEMYRLLEYAAGTFPNAKIAVIGYFPIISTSSDMNKVSRYFFKIVKFPHPFQFTLTNGVSKQFIKILRKKMAMRSRFWVTESNREMRDAIERINAKFEQPRVVFVESPITEQTCFGTQKSLLWDTDKDNFPADERYAERRKICPEVFSELKHHHYGKMSVRMCELAAIGHPNVEGARAFAEAIKNTLRPILDSARETNAF